MSSVYALKRRVQCFDGVVPAVHWLLPAVTKSVDVTLGSLMTRRVPNFQNVQAPLRASRVARRCWRTMSSSACDALVVMDGRIIRRRTQPSEDTQTVRLKTGHKSRPEGTRQFHVDGSAVTFITVPIARFSKYFKLNPQGGRILLTEVLARNVAGLLKRFRQCRPHC